MASSFSLAIFLLFISVMTLFPILKATHESGFSVELIHRDSPKSPFYDPNSTDFSNIHKAVERSRSRALHFQDIIRKSSLTSLSALTDDINVPFAALFPNFFEYLISINLGTPEEKIFAIIDTGSDLIWADCTPCKECQNKNAPLFNPQTSSSYKIIPCNSDSCSTLSTHSCGPSSECQYHYGYGDGSFVEGLLSTETIGFDSLDGRRFQIPSIIFGCSSKSVGNIMGVGIIGLGGGTLSIIRQLSSNIDSRFSYCLPSFKKLGSRLNFGSNAVVSESNAVTTPLIFGKPNTFYFLNLNQIIVSNQAIIVWQPEQTNPSSPQGNIIIDSGTTLTSIDNNALLSLENILKRTVSLPQVKRPNDNLRLCFDVSRAGSLTKLPDITFRFFGGASIVLPPSNAFIVPVQNTLCLAITSSGDAGKGINVFGNIAQQNFHIGYDLVAMQLTMAPKDCANSP